MNYTKSFFSFKGTLDRSRFFYGRAVIVLTMLSVAFSVSFFDPIWSNAAFELFHSLSSHQDIVSKLFSLENIFFLLFIAVDIYFTLALFSKRIRDVGFSPYWSVLIFIPVVGQIAFVMGYFVKGKEATKNDGDEVIKIINIDPVSAGLLSENYR